MINLYRNRHRGQRCVLVCNGPSLNSMDLSFLKNEICIGLNKIYLGFKEFNFYPKYYVCVNKKVLEQSHLEIKRLNCIKFLSNRCPGLFSSNALTYIIDTSKPHQRFCTDISKNLEEGWTVTYAALQIAFYLGFSEVVIIGMDHNFTYNGKPNEESKMEGNDPNHFHKDYFADGVKWDNPDLFNSEESYRIANEVFQGDGRNIIDATLDGQCNVFQKRSYKEIFGIV